MLKYYINLSKLYFQLKSHIVKKTVDKYVSKIILKFSAGCAVSLRSSEIKFWENVIIGHNYVLSSLTKDVIFMIFEFHIHLREM